MLMRANGPGIAQHDPKATTREMQYMLGPSILVFPIYSQAATHRCYIPHRHAEAAKPSPDGQLREDKWIDFWTGELVPGGAEVNVVPSMTELNGQDAF